MEIDDDGERFQGIAPEHRRAYARAHRAFHEAWTKTAHEPGYDKDHWELRRELHLGELLERWGRGLCF